jgi:DNA-binding GntR family transcriptional regulator
MAKGLLAVLAPKEKGGHSDKEDAAQDLIDAVKSGDAKAASLALARHYELCMASESEEDDDDEEY